jgi:hypothetical protein
MRRFLIRLVQVFALAIMGTGFLVDTSCAETKQQQEQFCSQIGGQWLPETNGSGNYTCIYTGWGGSTNYLNCTKEDKCTLTSCDRGEGCVKYTSKYHPKPGKPGSTKRDGTTVIMTAGTTADRNGRTRCATTLGAAGAALNGGLKAVAPSHTAPAVSTGALSNTQAVTGLAGIDKSAATPSLFSDRFNRRR